MMVLFKKRKALESVVEQQSSKIDSLELQTQEMAADIITYKSDLIPKYRGNNYITYTDAVTEINKKYIGQADWGVWAGNIIDVRAAFIVGKGIRVVKIDENADNELEFADEFIKNNNLLLSMPLIYAVEAEIEGKFLAKLFWQEEILKARFLSWTDHKYIIVTDEEDYLDYIEAFYKPTGGEKVTIKQPNFVYRKFGGRISNPNEATPKIWRSLTQIDEVDKAYRDMREINNILAAPIPYIRCETQEEAKATLEVVDKINMKTKKFLVGTGDLKFVTIPADTGKPLNDEIISKLKSISGNTGVPVHFMGLPELMSNRSTSENLMELIWASTVKERQIWQSAYTELLRKAIVMRNAKGETQLDPMKLEIQIPEISSKEWDMITQTWMPLYTENVITLELLLSKIPDLDIEAEKKRKEEEDKKAEVEFEKRKEDIKNNLDKDEKRRF